MDSSTVIDTSQALFACQALSGREKSRKKGGELALEKTLIEFWERKGRRREGRKDKKMGRRGRKWRLFSQFILDM